MNSEQIWEKIKKGVFVIAEAGKNFIQTEEEKPVSEYLRNAKELVDKAVWAGADAIKFQTHNVEDEQHPEVRIKASHFQGADRLAWVTRNTNATPVDDFWLPLKEYCDKKGIVFFSTPMSRGAAKRLMEAGVQLWKIGSGDLLDRVMFDYLRRTNLPIIMSSGASSLEEVVEGVKYLTAKNPRVALMHALSKYPGLPEEANIGVTELYRMIFEGSDIPIGFSENSIGIEPSVLAVVTGSTVIEKHFTIDRGLWGADHRVCSTPSEFKEMVEAIRKVQSSSAEKERWRLHPKFEAIMGNCMKELKEDEKPFRPVFQKALAAGENIPVGGLIRPESVYALRHRSALKGLPSDRYEDVIFKTAKVALKKYDPITEDVIGL